MPPRREKKKENTDEKRTNSRPDSKKKIPPTLEEVKATAPSKISGPEPSLKEIKHLLETSIKWNEVVYDSVKKMRRKFFWMTVAGWVKILIIVLPLVIGTFYIIPFLEPMIQMYKDLLQNVAPILGQNSAGSIQEIPNIGQVSPESFQEMLQQLKNQ